MTARTALMAAAVALSACGGAQTGAPLDHITMIPAAASLDPGQTDQMTTTAWYADGSSEDITRSVQYGLSDSRVLEINDDGLVTGVASGTGTVSADYLGKVALVALKVCQPATENCGAR